MDRAAGDHVAHASQVAVGMGALDFARSRGEVGADARCALHAGLHGDGHGPLT